MEPSGADRETGEGDERAIYPVRRHAPTGGKNSRKSSIHGDTELNRHFKGFSAAVASNAVSGKVYVRVYRESSPRNRHPKVVYAENSGKRLGRHVVHSSYVRFSLP